MVKALLSELRGILSDFFAMGNDWYCLAYCVACDASGCVILMVAFLLRNCEVE